MGNLDHTTGYGGGHPFGSRLGGWGRRANMAPQDSNFNRGNWVEVENRRHSLKQRQETGALVVQLTGARTGFLGGQIEALDRKSRARVEAVPDPGRQVELLQSLPRFGFLVSLTFLVEKSGLGTVETGRQPAADAGLSPAPHQPGS